MTQDELGKAMNVSYQAVSKWERDESQPDFDTMSKIANLFGVPLNYFADEESAASAAPANAEAARPQNYVQTPAKTMLGTCTECGKIIYEGDECETQPKLLCANCVKARQQKLIKSEQSRKYSKMHDLENIIGTGVDVKYFISVLAALALYIVFTVMCFTNKSFDDAGFYAFLMLILPLAAFGCVQAIAGTIDDLRDKDDEASYKLSVSLVTGAIFAAVNLVLYLVIYLAVDDNFYYLLMMVAGTLFSFTFVTQYLWGGSVAEIFTCGGFTFKLPGFIFSLSLDSILLMIFLKIVLGILAAIIFVITTVFFAVVAIFGSVILFVPSLIAKSAKVGRAKAEYKQLKAQ